MRIHAMRGKIPFVSKKRQSKRLVGHTRSFKPVVFTAAQIKLINERNQNV